MQPTSYEWGVLKWKTSILIEACHFYYIFISYSIEQICMFKYQNKNSYFEFIIQTILFCFETKTNIKTHISHQCFIKVMIFMMITPCISTQYQTIVISHHRRVRPLSLLRHNIFAENELFLIFSIWYQKKKR